MCNDTSHGRRERSRLPLRVAPEHEELELVRVVQSVGSEEPAALECRLRRRGYATRERCGSALVPSLSCRPCTLIVS